MHSPRSYEPPYRPQPRWGRFPGRTGVWIIVFGTVIGLLGTVIAGSEPGAVLGVLLVVTTLIAGLAVRFDAVHLIIPVPAIAYLVAGLIAGLVHDRADISTRSALAVSALQATASGFLAIAIATLVAITITTARRLRARGTPPPRRRSYRGY